MREIGEQWIEKATDACIRRWKDRLCFWQDVKGSRLNNMYRGDCPLSIQIRLSKTSALSMRMGCRDAVARSIRGSVGLFVKDIENRPK